MFSHTENPRYVPESKGGKCPGCGQWVEISYSPQFTFDLPPEADYIIEPHSCPKAVAGVPPEEGSLTG